MIDMNLKLDNWKKRLLDLGKRNQLLNYRDTRRSNLRITKPEIFSLWDSFVVNEQPLEFPLADDEQVSGEQLTLLDGEDTAGVYEPAVLTNKSVKDQQATLRNLRNKARTIMEEQGVNVLYLSFGFLRWTEAAQSRYQFDSPLVLVPVTLSWESITAPFVLSLHEDEIVVNPTLAYKMENDFGVKLPDLDPEGTLSDYFSRVRDIVSALHWEVVPEVGLSLLSFLKINMYHDLERHREAILNNPVIRTLGGDASAVDHDLSFLEDFDHDANITPENTFQVVDADSSQQDAIICAKRGISFVLQGPPGTGKSQTITNIIAECLADGKKVLFVSEKMAALEVVHKRLKDAGLDDFCLILHSHKANKKSTLDQLGRVLNLAHQKAALSEEAHQKLSQLADDKKRLNDYSAAIFTVIEPLHKTIYEANGELANLQSYEEVIFSIPEVRQTTPQIYNGYINQLTKFKNTITGLSIDYQNTPWRDANAEYVTNELRHDINAHLSALIPQCGQTQKIYDNINDALGLTLDSSFSEWEQNIALLGDASQAPKIPVFWITEGDIAALSQEAALGKDLQAECLGQRDVVLSLQKEIKQNDPAADFSRFEQLLTVAEIEQHTAAIKSHISQSPYYTKWASCSDWAAVKALYAEMSGCVEECTALIEAVTNGFEREIFSIDYKAMYLRFKADYTSFFKVFNGQYRADKRLVQGLCREPGKKFSDDEIISLLNQLRRLDELREQLSGKEGLLSAAFGNLYQAERTDLPALKAYLIAYDLMCQCLDALEKLQTSTVAFDENEDFFRAHFGSLFVGLDTDWEQIQSVLAWAEQFRERYGNAVTSSETFLKHIFSSDEKTALCAQYSAELRHVYDAFRPEFDWFQALFDPVDELCHTEMPKLAARMGDCQNNLAALEEWIDFRTARSRCYDVGLREYIEKVEAKNVQADRIVPVFKKRFFRLWLDSVLLEYPVVANFRHKVQENTIQEFAQLDKLQFSIARSRIRSRLINGLPSLDHFTSGVDEVSVLKRELGKQRRIMPIRLLFKRIPNLILSLKPCLMMSPLSVSLFLESDAFMFDTVIFDEASQVCTENAIGAILRGKQVIIAGDSKQLPPTNFFTANAGESDFDTDSDNEDEYDDTAGYESILDEAALLPERTLLWHYRSRHEHLIAFSNAKIYKNNLITFPSNVDRMPDIGVEYIYVRAGFYDRGGRKGNTIEAARVAELVFEHFRKFPKRSLGVIAFGEVQQMAIDTAIRKMRLEHQEFEPFFREDEHDAFFVKSLENVQGDERDTIIFSIGYAKDATGVMRMNFGPLSQVGGERRLNVAMTRAKYNVKLVGSIMPTDIDIDRVSADGPKLLRSYIDYAINGPSVLASEITEQDMVEHDSPFEAAVYNFLDRKGYKLATQVGCSCLIWPSSIRRSVGDMSWALSVTGPLITPHGPRVSGIGCVRMCWRAWGGKSIGSGPRTGSKIPSPRGTGWLKR